MDNLVRTILLQSLLADARASLDAAAGDLSLVAGIATGPLARDVGHISDAVEHVIEGLAATAQHWQESLDEPEAPS